MSTTTRQPNAAASATFMARKAEIDDLPVRLQVASADHFNAMPDDVHCCLAGTLGQVASS